MNAHEPTDRRLGRSFMLVFALLAAGILATGYLYYRNFERHYRSEAERQLAVEVSAGFPGRRVTVLDRCGNRQAERRTRNLMRVE